MNLFRAFPALKRQAGLTTKEIALVGISTIAWDDSGAYFEINKPKYWRADDAGRTVIGLGGIGGAIEPGESPLVCLRRELQEELGVRPRLEHPERTFLIQDWELTDEFSLQPSKKHPTPFLVLLTQPQLGGPGVPDHLAIVCFQTRLRGTPRLGDLRGFVRIEDSTLPEFFDRSEWSLEGAQALPGVTFQVEPPLPRNSVIRPVLTARAFQILVRAGHV